MPTDGRSGVEIAFESVLGQDVLEDIANTLRPAAEAKGLKFEICLPSKPLHLQTDPRSLSQILINLTNNAIKFTQQGSVQLELKRRKEKGQQFVEFSVADTGIGIPAEEQVKLFDAFTRLNNPALQYQEGTGLGLYLSQKLADLLGGKIKLQSKPEQGSIFTLILEEK